MSQTDALVSPADHAADHVRVRAYIDRIGGLPAFWRRFDLSYRVAQRIYSGKRPCPPRILAAIRADSGENRHG